MTNESYKTLGRRLKAARKEKGIKQTALANDASLSVNVISEWETGVSYPSLRGLFRVCVALGVSSDYLLGLES